MALCGVDVGGTFTDVVLVDEETGGLMVTKVRSSHPTPDTAVLFGMEQVGDGQSIARLDYFVHGTTVGLNAVIERRGPKLVMLATRGFRDVLELRRSNQAEDPYNLFWRPRPPLIPRALRYPITERVSAAGEIVTPIVTGDVEEALRAAEEADAEGIVVAFINAYANPAHEREVGRIIRELGFAGDVTLSHEVSREHREFERTSTATISAFIRPHVSDYLARLSGNLQARGFAGTSLITRSGGGALTFSEGEERPFETLLSGPVAGVEGAAYIARRLGHRAIITADVGGTSFDTALVLDGRPIIMHEGEIAGMPVQTPWVDVRAIGAGGGSIAAVDAGGLLRVGPKSAGSNPGPAAYGSGGTEATVTDAAVVLGMFPVRDLSGEVMLDSDLAEAALQPLADRLRRGVPEVAAGILQIAASKMANAIREVTVESGEDPRTAVLVPYGGAGPLFATQLADELGIAEIIVPPHPGVFSALGLLVTDAVQVRSQTRLLPLEDTSLGEVATSLGELFGEIASGTGEAVTPASAVRSASLDLRYVGQEHYLTVPVDFTAGELRADASAIERDFAERYQRTFGAALATAVEIIGIRAELRRSLQDGSRLELAPHAGTTASSGEDQANAYSMRAKEWRGFEVVDRAAMEPDGVVFGPAMIVEGTATTYVDSGYRARLGDLGSIHLSRRNPERSVA